MARCRGLSPRGSYLWKVRIGFPGVWCGEGPALMVSQCAVDVEVGGRQPLVAEAQAPGQGQGCFVRWLNVCLKPVESQVGEGVLHGDGEPLGHVTLPGGRGKGCVAEGRTLVAAPDDRVDVDR